MKGNKLPDFFEISSLITAFLEIIQIFSVKNGII